MSLTTHSKAFFSGSRVKISKESPLFVEASFPRTCFICYQRGAQMAFYVPPGAHGGGRGGKLRLDWLSSGIKAGTKGLYFGDWCSLTDVTPGLP